MEIEYSDVVVVGGGPAGSCAASFLSKQGRKVILLEKERFPRHHIGESTLIGLTKLLEIEIGVGSKIASAGFLLKTGASYIWGNNRTPWSFHFWEVFEKDRVAYEVDRAKFDEILLRHSSSLGTDVREESRVTRVLFDGKRAIGVNYIDSNSKKHTILAKFTVDASGLAAVLGSQLKVRRQYERIRNIAIYGYWDGDNLPYDELGGDITPEDKTNILVVAHERCWIWVIPLAGQRISVGIVFDIADIPLLQAQGRSSFYMEKVLGCDEVKKVLRTSSFLKEEPLRIIQDWSQVSEEVIGPGYILTGDAAAFVDPILSSGVTLAVTFGIAAGRTVNTILEYGEAASWAYTWYKHAYTNAYNDFRRMADFWYLGSGHKEDWFYIAYEQIRQTARVELDRRKAFIHLASGTFTTGEFIDRECYVDSKTFPITVYFSPHSHYAFFSPNDRLQVAQHLTEFPEELVKPTFESVPASDLDSNKGHNDNDQALQNPKLLSNLRIGIYTRVKDPFIDICCYLSQFEGEKTNGVYFPLSPSQLAFFRALNGRNTLEEISYKTRTPMRRVRKIIDNLMHEGLMER